MKQDDLTEGKNQMLHSYKKLYSVKLTQSKS